MLHVVRIFTSCSAKLLKRFFGNSFELICCPCLIHSFTPFVSHASKAFSIQFSVYASAMHGKCKRVPMTRRDILLKHINYAEGTRIFHKNEQEQLNTKFSFAFSRFFFFLFLSQKVFFGKCWCGVAAHVFLIKISF